ncbi:MAG: hypothetical protein SF123_03430 [Chloroflexota bacterium]|nr:hypothetical protein [Chloroflexota bacterium]
MTTILVQLSDKAWTMRALHEACALARKQQETVTLLRLMQVEHISYLGSEFGNVAIDHQEYERLQEYAATAEDYGVEVEVEQMQCLSMIDATADAAELLEARAVFAHIPASRIPFLHELRVHHLERRLRGTGRLLYTLDEQPAHTGRGSQLPNATSAAGS